MLPRGELLPVSAVGHTGFTGTSLVVVPELDLTVSLLANALSFAPDKSEFFRTRRVFHNLVAAAVTSVPGRCGEE
jgi:CubicO group peptidase (beta-lactamase class C family)